MHQQQQQHKVPIKSADSILDEFLLGQPNQQQNFLKRATPQGTTKLKVPPSATYTKPFVGTTQRQQNLLFSISDDGGASGQHPIYQHQNGPNNTSIESAASHIVQIQRKLIGFFFVYATIIITLYLTYAVYSYCQQSQFRRQQQQFAEFATLAGQPAGSGITPASSLVAASNSADSNEHQPANGPSRDHLQGVDSTTSKSMQEFQTKLEGKIHLLERYIEMLALDLEDTKGRLREREKCACSIGCSFNGTRYSDGQKWQQKCDTCTCQAGKISCLPRDCPKLANECEDSVQLPGQCCPTCMKKCKINNILVRHGHSFQPSNPNGKPASKQCKCHDGLIKCEPFKQKGAVVKQSEGGRPLPVAAAKNRTLEYLKSILGSHNAQMPLQLDDGSPPPRIAMMRNSSDINNLVGNSD